MFHIYDKIRNNEVYFIAEVSANHSGKKENALEIVRQAAKAGADCVKLQTYTADSLTIDCDNQYFQIKGGLWDGRNLYELYQEAGTPYEWHADIKKECEEYGLDFLSTPFDADAVDFLEDLGAEAYKIASFELVDIPLIEYAASKGKPMIISTGMGSPEEIQDALDACYRVGNRQVILLKCCSEYPAAWADMHLGSIPDMKERFRVPVGLSDHSIGSLGAVVGVSLGALVVEKHVMLPGTVSADSAFSMTMEEYADMIRDVKNAKLAAGGPDYTLTEGEKKQTVFRRSIFAVRDIEAGEKFTSENVRIIRPGHGIAPKYLRDILGKESGRRIWRGEPITEEDLGDLAGTQAGVHLRAATMDDLELVYDWANDPEVRNNSFTTAPITKEEHCAWYANAMKSEDVAIYIMVCEGADVGQARIKILNDEAEVSYSIAREFRGRGYGKKIISLLKDRVRSDFPRVRKLIARVKPDNPGSCKVFAANGYEKKSTVYELEMK